jgi:hypothetical protein
MYLFIIYLFIICLFICKFIYLYNVHDVCVGPEFVVFIPFHPGLVVVRANLVSPIASDDQVSLFTFMQLYFLAREVQQSLRCYDSLYSDCDGKTVLQDWVGTAVFTGLVWCVGMAVYRTVVVVSLEGL